MKKSRLIALVLVVVAVIAAVICTVYIKYDKSYHSAKVDLYFLNAEATGIVATPQKIRYRSESELIQNTLEKLRRGPASSSKLGKIMPKDTAVSSIEIMGNDYLTVEFDEKFLSEDPSRNVLNTYAVVKTLSSTACVSNVKVLVNGENIKDRDGKNLGFISASDINLETEEYQSELLEVGLYFADSSKKQLVREMRTIKITDQQPIAQYIINELIKGTQSKGMNSVLSENTVLVSVDIEDNICYLNFKSGFLSDNAGDETHEKLVIYSIVNSLTELQTIGRVQFYMDGKRIEKFGNMNIKDYISRDTTIINEEEEK